VGVADEAQGDEIAQHHRTADKKAVHEDVPVHQTEAVVGYGLDNVHGSGGCGFTGDIGHWSEVERQEHGTTQWARYAEHAVDKAR